VTTGASRFAAPLSPHDNIMITCRPGKRLDASHTPWAPRRIHDTSQERLQKAQRSVDASATAMQGKYRQTYHFMVPAYWINDPNGCIFLNGTCHLYHQHHPYSPNWGAMHWGHATSSDFVH